MISLLIESKTYQKNTIEVKLKSKLMIISWDVPPSSSGSGILINNIFNNQNCVYVGEKYELKSGVNGHYYFSPIFGNLPRIGKYLKWFSFLYYAIKIIQIQKKEKCEKALVIFPDEFYLILTFVLHKFSGIKYFTWFHNTYSFNRKKILYLLSIFIEPLIVKNAEVNFVLSDALNTVYSKKYKKIKFVTLLHGFSEKFIKKHKISLRNDKITNFVYTGTFNESVKDASLRMCREVIKDKNHKLHIFGNNKKAFKKHGINKKNVFFYEFIEDNIFYEKISKFDIALIPLGLSGSLSKFEYETIFPTRLIPILLVGIPFIAHVPKESFLFKFLIKNEIGCVVTEKSENSIAEQINNLKNNYKLRKKLSEQSIKVSKNFYALKILKRINSYL